MKKMILIAVKTDLYYGYVVAIECVYAGLEKECQLYRDIIIKEIEATNKIRMQEASMYVHTFGIDHFKNINPFQGCPNVSDNDAVCGIANNLLTDYNARYNVNFTLPHKYVGWELHIV